jgi:hypothetical protein
VNHHTCKPLGATSIDPSLRGNEHMDPAVREPLEATRDRGGEAAQNRAMPAGEYGNPMRLDIGQQRCAPRAPAGSWRIAHVYTGAIVQDPGKVRGVRAHRFDVVRDHLGDYTSRT